MLGMLAGALIGLGAMFCTLMYLMPLAMLIQHFGPTVNGSVPVTWIGMASNLLPVIAGNLVGGSVLVGLTYHVIYQRGKSTRNSPRTIEPSKET